MFRREGGAVRPRGAGQVLERCPSFVTVAPGRKVHCTKPAGHAPDADVHQGQLRVTLPDGQEQIAFLVWSSWPIPSDDQRPRAPR
jgi:hypothetical protein